MNLDANKVIDSLLNQVGELSKQIAMMNIELEARRAEMTPEVKEEEENGATV